MYKYQRDELEQAIQCLANRYPKCFFTNPRQRRPLKKNIINDLEKDGAPLASELLAEGVQWYMSHIGYLSVLEGGLKRVDINGDAVGTVTELEAHVAAKKLEEIRNERRAVQDPIRTATALVANGRIAEDQLRKIPAPAIAKPAAVCAELARLHKAVIDPNSAISIKLENADIRAAVTAVVMGVVLKEAQAVIDRTKTLGVEES
jgi:sRNA-binding protein